MFHLLVPYHANAKGNINSILSSFSFFNALYFFSGFAQVLYVDANVTPMTAVSGGGVIFSCIYGDKHPVDRKFFCQGDIQNCPSGSNKRFLQYYTNNKLLVLMTNLTPRDSGMYYCRGALRGKSYTITTFNMEVKEGESSFSHSDQRCWSVSSYCRAQ